MDVTIAWPPVPGTGSPARAGCCGVTPGRTWTPPACSTFSRWTKPDSVEGSPGHPSCGRNAAACCETSAWRWATSETPPPCPPWNGRLPIRNRWWPSTPGGRWSKSGGGLGVLREIRSARQLGVAVSAVEAEAELVVAPFFARQNVGRAQQGFAVPPGQGQSREGADFLLGFIVVGRRRLRPALNAKGPGLDQAGGSQGNPGE